MTEVDVLIAGGGPTGLVLACELARRGVGCRIVDRSAEFFGGSRADGLQPRSLEVFDDLGVLDAVLAAGDTGTPVRGYQGDTVIWEGRMAELFEPTPDVPYPNPWFVPQYRTEEILRGHLGGWGVHVERATELVDLTQDSGAVVATLTRHGVTEQVRARYLVGADGGGSTVRGTLGIGFPGETDDATRMLLADVRIPGWSRDHVRIWSAGTAEAVTLMPL
ncbi:MAG: FAD-dependent monooxygenase, partial [Kutzneria sp.]|nr:FAD-dependent monooxygenase [Kutzneria sp.]